MILNSHFEQGSLVTRARTTQIGHEVKHRRSEIVVGWGTKKEYLRESFVTILEADSRKGVILSF